MKSVIMMVVLMCGFVSEVSADEIKPKENSVAPKRALKEIELSDGQMLKGYVSEQQDTILLTLKTGEVLTLPRASVRRIEDASSSHVGDVTTHRTRYLFSPSAMMLKEGEGYLSQKELFFTSAAYGVTDWLSIVVGGALPFWFVDEGFNLIGGVKLGGSVHDQVHLSVGAEGLVLPGVSSDNGTAFGGVFFGTVTVGDADRHITLNAGKPFTSKDVFDVTLFSLSGYYRLTDNVGIMTENWLFLEDDDKDYLLLHAFALRFTPGSFSIDAGAIFAGVGIPVPWVDFSWSFGG